MIRTFMIPVDAEWGDEFVFLDNWAKFFSKLTCKGINFQHEKVEEGGYKKYRFTFPEDFDEEEICALIKECELC